MGAARGQTHFFILSSGRSRSIKNSAGQGCLLPTAPYRGGFIVTVPLQAPKCAAGAAWGSSWGWEQDLQALPSSLRALQTSRDVPGALGSSPEASSCSLANKIPRAVLQHCLQTRATSPCPAPECSLQGLTMPSRDFGVLAPTPEQEAAFFPCFNRGQPWVGDAVTRGAGEEGRFSGFSLLVFWSVAAFGGQTAEKPRGEVSKDNEPLLPGSANKECASGSGLISGCCLKQPFTIRELMAKAGGGCL